MSLDYYKMIKALFGFRPTSQDFKQQNHKLVDYFPGKEMDLSDNGEGFQETIEITK